MTQNSQQLSRKRKRGPGKPFVKGDPRISPGGLPAEAREFSARYREALAAALSKPSKSDPNGALTPFEQGLERLAELFAAGTPWGVAEVLDRLIGKPKQSVEASGADGGPLKTLVEIIHVGAKGENSG